jgi:hypothetical protein
MVTIGVVLLLPCVICYVLYTDGFNNVKTRMIPREKIVAIIYNAPNGISVSEIPPGTRIVLARVFHGIADMSLEEYQVFYLPLRIGRNELSDVRQDEVFSEDILKSVRHSELMQQEPSDTKYAILRKGTDVSLLNVFAGRWITDIDIAVLYYP